MFACDPARTPDLVKALFDVVGISGRGPSAGQVADAKAALRRDLEIDSRQNSTLLKQLAYADQYDEPVPDPGEKRGAVRSAEAPLLRDAANTYLNEPLRQGRADAGSEVSERRGVRP